MDKKIIETPSIYWENLDNNNIIINDISNNIYVKNKINLICVLAGGIQNNGDVNEFVKARLDKAIELYNKYNNSYILVLGGGTYHKTPHINKEGFVVHESTCCAIYLNNNGIPGYHIMREWSSYDTIANGFFAFTNYINILDIDILYVITSEFHIERSKLIFDYFNKLFNKNITIYYKETYNNLDDNTLKIRRDREKSSILNFKKNFLENKKSLNEFVLWFYTKHKAYASIINYIKDDTINKTY